MAYLNIMTRIEDREDDELLHDLGGRDHPSFFFLDAQGEVLARHDAEDTSVNAFEETGARVKRSLELRKKADAGDASSKIDLAIVRGELGILEFPDVEAAIEGATLTPEQSVAFNTLWADTTVSDMTLVLRKNRDEATRSMVTEEIRKLYDKGARPARPVNRRLYWAVLAGQAVANKEAPLLRDAIEAIRGIAGAEPTERDKQMLSELEGRLRELEAAK